MITRAVPKKSALDFFGHARRALWLPAFLLLLATGCAALPPPGAAPSPEVVQQRRAALSSIAYWDLRGRVGVRLPDEGAHASLRWRHRGDGEEVDLTGPFGGGHARLQYDATGARLRDARGREYQGADAETLLYRTTGWHVPLAALTYWIRGLPVPAVAAAEQLDEHGRLRALKQLGWDIEFLAYDSVGEYELPSKLYLARGADATRVEVRLALSRWDIGQPGAPSAP